VSDSSPLRMDAKPLRGTRDLHWGQRAHRRIIASPGVQELHKRQHRIRILLIAFAGNNFSSIMRRVT